MTTTPTQIKQAAPRNIELDYLRVICTLLIVCLHITGVDAAKLHLQQGSTESVIYAFLQLVLCMGLPPFFMLSGAFMISKEITSPLVFYRRSFSRLLPWSIFFFMVGSFFKMLNTSYNGGASVWDTDFVSFYYTWFARGGTGILWFIPALMGLYLLTPVLVWIRERVRFAHFCLLTAAVFAATNYLLTPHLGADYASYGINWFKGMFFIGHYMLGYCIYTFCKQNKSRWFNATTIGAVFIITLICCAVWIGPSYTEGSGFHPQLNAQGALPIILSALLFTFFNKVTLPPSRIVSTISSCSIVIYLSHNYMPLPIIRFGLKYAGLWETAYRDSLLLQVGCYAVAIPFAVLVALALQRGAQHLFSHASQRAAQP